jgi:hypothetical protein
LSTDTKLGNLQDTTDHPKLENPGSNESKRSSAGASILKSVAEYCTKEHKKGSELAHYMLGISIYGNNTIGPSIFWDDVRQTNGVSQVKCTADIREYIEKFDNRKDLFSESYYDSSCIGMYSICVEREKVDTDGYVDWAFANIPLYNMPIIVSPRNLTPE